MSLVNGLRALLLALLLASLGIGAWQRHALKSARAEVLAARAEALGERTARQQEAAARSEEARRTARVQEALDAEHQSRQQALVDLRRADAAARSLRERTEQLAAAARCAAGDPAAAAGGAPAAAPADLLADMLGRLDGAAGELARYADDARIAGQLCERTYRALTP